MPPIHQERSFERSTSELAAVFAFLAEAAGPAGLNEKDRYALDFAAEELFTNCVKYNDGSGPIRLRFKIEHSQLFLAFVDHGASPFDPATADDPKVESGIEDRVPGGLGLHLIRSMFDTLEHRHENDALTVEVSKQLATDDQSSATGL